MSGMRLTTGIIAQLKTGFGDFHEESHQEKSDELDALGGYLKLTRDGDMVVFILDDDRDAEDLGITFFQGIDGGILSRLNGHLADAGLELVDGTCKLFLDHWYDGVDANHWDISLSGAGYTEISDVGN